MGPSLEVLVALVLEFVLPALVKLHHHVPDIGWHALIFDVVNHLLLEFIGQDCERFGLWRCRNLLKKVVSECVLEARVFKEDCLRPDIKHSVVALDYSIILGQQLWKEWPNEKSSGYIFISSEVDVIYLPIFYGLIMARSA